MIELPTNNSAVNHTLDLQDLENLETKWLNEDHCLVLGPHGNEKLYCKIEGECAELDQCIYQYYVDNPASDHQNS